MKRIASHRLLRHGALLSLLLLFTACETRPPVRVDAPAETASPTAARQAEQVGEFVVAAREYERLAQTAKPPLRQEYTLRGVSALIKAGQWREANDRLVTVDVSRLDSHFQAWKRLLEARLALAQNLPETALRYLAQAEKLKPTPTLQGEILAARAAIDLAEQRPLAAVQSLLARDRLLTEADELTANQRQLWGALELVPRETLVREQAQARDPILAAWLALAIQARDNAAAPQRLANAVSQWRQQYPSHPATAAFLKQLTAPAAGLIGPVTRIALLLPISSDYAQAAGAVRDGFLAMHNASRRSDKPVVQVYDTGNDPSQLPAIYEKAVADGAQLVVGPLGVEAVDTLISKGSLTVPTLLLSHTSKDLGDAPQVFQFGLPPEQEAVQAAERAYLDGHRRVAILYPDNAFGQRMNTAFSQAWQRLGGLVVVSQAYVADDKEYSTPVKQMLNIVQSDKRKALLEERLRVRLKSEARPREDIDVIFLAADAKRARLIRPQLSYHRVSRLPVYSTSHLFSGRGDPVSDTDLDGITFGDMPWLLVGGGRLADLRSTLQRDWPFARTALDRLYALGMDAYALIPELNRLRSEPGARLAGATSGLSIDRDNRIHRQLAWAQFKRGVPKLLDTFLRQKNQYDTDDGTDAARPGPGR